MSSPSPALLSRPPWSPGALPRADADALLACVARLQQQEQQGRTSTALRGKNLALVGADGAPSALQQAAEALGAKVTRLDRTALQPGDRGGARLLGRLYDAIDCSGFDEAARAAAARDAGVPVYDGLDRPEHPLQALGALLALQQAGGAPLAGLPVRLLGRDDLPAAHALRQAAELAGVQLRPALDRRTELAVQACADGCRPLHRERELPAGDTARQRRYVLQALLLRTLS